MRSLAASILRGAGVARALVRPFAAMSAVDATASAAPPRLTNLKLDKTTHELLARMKAQEAARVALADAPPSLSAAVVRLSSAGATGAVVQLDARVFGAPLRRDIVHRCIVWQEANARTTLYKTKTRAEVRGGGRKPWKQKGTGKARVGSIRSPLWVGGGTAHGPKLRDWSSLLQKKVRRLGMRIALSAKLRDGRLVVVEGLSLDAAGEEGGTGAKGGGSGKTKDAAAALGAHGVDSGRRVLFVDHPAPPTPFASALANVPRARALASVGANVRDIVLAEKLFVTPAALEAITARLLRED